MDESEESRGLVFHLPRVHGIHLRLDRRARAEKIMTHCLRHPVRMSGAVGYLKSDAHRAARNRQHARSVASFSFSLPLRQQQHPGHAALGSGPVGRGERSNRFFHKTGSEPPLRWFNFQPSTDFSKKLTNPSPHVTSKRITPRGYFARMKSGSDCLTSSIDCS